MPELKSYRDVQKYFHQLEMLGSHLGLERVCKILKELGNPQNHLRTIHIAGTNGKGSVAAMLASTLTRAGYRTGLYTSPHLVDFRERIRIDGRKIPEEDVVRFANLVKSKGIGLTYFEFTTALAFQYFKKQEVDFLVLEVGLGGRLDATNTVKPLLSIITNISLEHTNYLGETVEEIAAEKAGIIKENVPVLTSCKGAALEIIKEKAADTHSEILKPEKLNKTASDLQSQTFTYKDTEISLPLLGDFQLDNAAIALKAAEYLKGKGSKISENSIKSGLESVRWPGRLEIHSEKPLIILDGAHNPAGISALTAFLKTLSYRKLILVFSVMDDKDYRKMLDIITPLTDKTILTKANIDRALQPEKIAEYLEESGKDVLIEKDVKKALDTALKTAAENDMILVTGSIYLVGNVKEVISNEPKRV